MFSHLTPLKISVLLVLQVLLLFVAIGLEAMVGYVSAGLAFTAVVWLVVVPKAMRAGSRTGDNEKGRS